MLWSILCNLVQVKKIIDNDCLLNNDNYFSNSYCDIVTPNSKRKQILW